MVNHRLFTRVEFARLAGVSGAAITKACAGRLADACVGKRIDISHPDAVAYLENNRGGGQSRSNDGDQTAPPATVAEKKPHVRGTAAAKQKRKQTAPPEVAWLEAKKKTQKPKATTAEPGPTGADAFVEVPKDIQTFADMTLRELIERFGTDTRFVDWLKATQIIEAINEKRLKNAETQGELVSRHVVKVGILEPINTAHVKMLTDGAHTIAKRSHAMALAGRDVEDIEKFVVDQISSFIRSIKAKVARTMENA